jgi:zinc protease
MIKRAVLLWIFLFVMAAFAGTATLAQQPAPAANPPNSTQQDQKNGTGIVPPGVTLIPQMPAPGAPKPFQFPQAATKTLANGLRVFVVSDSRDPGIAARLVLLSAGPIKDPAGMPGVAQMTANLLTQGTEKRSAKEIAEAIDFVGGTLTASAGRDTTAVTLDVVKKDLPVGLDLMSDIVLHPAFRADELDRQRRQLLSNLTVQYSDPEYLASVVFARVLYGSSPYGLPPEGTPETVKKLGRDDLVKYHAANYAPNQALLAFAGDITSDEAFAAAEKYFGSWPKVDVSASVPPPPESLSGRHIWLIDKPDAVQTQIRVGKPGISRGDPNYIPVLVTNRIYGGGYNSRLNTEVRIKKGLTYGAFSAFTSHRYAGSFTVGTFSRTEATVEATKLVVDLIEKMSTGEVTQQELDFARDYLAGVYPIQTETAEQVADRVLTAAVYDLPPDYNSTYPDIIRRVTSAQVEAMAKEYFSAADLDIVLAGNVGAFLDDLKKTFPNAEMEEVPFDQVDLLSPGLRKPKEADSAPTAESIAQGKQLLLAAANAAGGDALASVSTLGLIESGKLYESDGDKAVRVNWQIAYPNRSRGDVSLGDQKIVQGCDGNSAWLQLPDRTVDVSHVMNEFERGIALFGGGWGVYQQVLAGKLEGHSIGEEVIDGKKTLGVAVQAPFGPVRLYFDPATHLLAVARYQSAGPRGASDDEQRWSDYRSVQGRQFAFSTLIYRDGVKFVESTIQQLDLNPKLDDSIFSKSQPASSK